MENTFAKTLQLQRNVTLEEYNEKSSDLTTWGLHTIINLRECNHSYLKDPIRIKQYAIDLTDLIKMKRFGEPMVERFGEPPLYEGYSMFQFIETSNICGHLDELDNRAFIDIFSCKYYDQIKAVEFSAKYFESKDYDYKIILRK